MRELSGLYYPNRIARAFLVAIADVMGEQGRYNLLELADMTSYANALPPDTLERRFDFAHIAALNASLEVMYGVRGGRGMALRIGRATFAKGLRHFGVLRAMADPAFRVLPLLTQAEMGLQALAGVLNHFSDQACTTSTQSDTFTFEVATCPMCWGRSAERPVCHAMVGILQETVRWATNGYVFYVRETACQATGAPQCVFRINKRAIGEGL